MNEQILITVKTYPTLSKKHGELVCTAGIREDGSWVRMYPVPFRRLRDYKKYKKYQWLSTRLRKRKNDPRPESYTPDLDSIKLGGVLTTSNQWAERCRLILQKGEVYNDMTELIAKANNNDLSLATYKPTEVIDFVAEAVERQWSADKVQMIRQARQQGDLFAGDSQFEEEFKLVDKVPYKFSYRFKDADGKDRKLMIEDWETGALYWNCLKLSGGDEDTAVKKVKEKYLAEFSNRDLYFYVGTTKQYHGWASNPFVIVGTFTPPKNRHPELSLWDS
ncbi:MAG: hypothetical protein PF904_19405 [Kiritimatiellae bacterium]|jgi:hypothetical protein|nr:hypothetical protein [Kiritimatiellia bacterium]